MGIVFYILIKKKLKKNCNSYNCNYYVTKLNVYSLAHQSTRNSLKFPTTFTTHSQDGDYIAGRGIILRQTTLLFIYPSDRKRQIQRGIPGDHKACTYKLDLRVMNHRVHPAKIGSVLSRFRVYMYFI